MVDTLGLGDLRWTFKALIKLLNSFAELELGAELIKDIQVSAQAIEKIETFERRRKPYFPKGSLRKAVNEAAVVLQQPQTDETTRQVKRLLEPFLVEEQKYKGIKQQYIRDLDSVMVKRPLRVGAGFEAQFASPDIKGLTLHAALQKGPDNVNRVVRKQSLPDLRLCLEIMESSLKNDEDVRDVLTSGLFYYIDQLAHGRFPRPRRCSCDDKRWFLAIKREQFYCCKTCKNHARQGNSKKEKRY